MKLNQVSEITTKIKNQVCFAKSATNEGNTKSRREGKLHFMVAAPQASFTSLGDYAETITMLL